MRGSERLRKLRTKLKGIQNTEDAIPVFRRSLRKQKSLSNFFPHKEAVSMRGAIDALESKFNEAEAVVTGKSQSNFHEMDQEDMFRSYGEPDLDGVDPEVDEMFEEGYDMK